jgi:type III secretory pathway component EscT
MDNQLIIAMVIALVVVVMYSRMSPSGKLPELGMPTKGTCAYNCMTTALNSGGSSQAEVACIKACPQ